MNATRFGLTYGVSSREPLTRAGELARHAEELGFARMWFVDVQLSMKDAYIAMALAAQATSAIHLGPGVSNPVTRHVSVTANGLSAVHELSHGRAMAGYGLGHTAVYPVGLKPAKLAPFEQDLQALRSLLAGNIVSTGNVSYELLTVDKQLPPIPLYVAATQKRMLELAGRCADGVILLGAAEPAFVRWQVEQVRNGLAAAGRKRSEIRIELWLGMSVSDEQPATALNDVRAFAAAQARVLNRWSGPIPGPLEGHRAEFALADEGYDLSQHLSVAGRNTRLISDALANVIAIAGDSRQCRARLEDLMTLDVDDVTFTLLSGGRRRRLEDLATLIAPMARPNEE